MNRWKVTLLHDPFLKEAPRGQDREPRFVHCPRQRSIKDGIESKAAMPLACAAYSGLRGHPDRMAVI